MRKRPSKAVISEVAFSSSDVGKTLSDFSERIERLEAEVFGTGADVFAPTPVKRGKGRRPKLEPEELLQRRDRLTAWVEQNWPYLSVALSKAKNSPQAIAAITAAKRRMPGVFQAPFYNDPEKHEAALWHFLNSGRFHGNPRNLAGAMAGLPELSWKRSFDICSNHPCTLPLAPEACRDYMRRNFPDRWRELREVTTPEQVKAILAKSRTQDPTYIHLKEHPETALDWFKAGNPSELRDQEGYFRLD
jgi:hypothetical protein